MGHTPGYTLIPYQTQTTTHTTIKTSPTERSALSSQLGKPQQAPPAQPTRVLREPLTRCRGELQFSAVARLTPARLPRSRRALVFRTQQLPRHLLHKSHRASCWAPQKERKMRQLQLFFDDVRPQAVAGRRGMQDSDAASSASLVRSLCKRPWQAAAARRTNEEAAIRPLRSVGGS